ncbi:MAG: DUF2029 domain-containing protein [Anaerolineales bacterium]|nr:DUF2029 domain-containing protein [Anaerolineales bacterium]
MFAIAAFAFYRGSNWRLLGPPFQPLSGQDFRQILRASEELSKGENIYQHAVPYATDPDFAEFLTWQAAPYPYSPIVAVLASPLLSFSTTNALIFWVAMSWLFLVATGIVIFRGIAKDVSIVGASMLLFYYLMYGPVHLNLNLVQLDICILFLLALTYLLYQRRSIWAGVALGLAISLKLLVAPIVVYFLWKRDWRVSVTAVATAGALSLVGFAMAGWNLLPDFMQVNYLWSVTDMLSFPFNQSLKGFGLRLFTVNPYIEPLVVLPIVAVILRWTGILLAIGLWLGLVSRSDNRGHMLGFLEYGFTVSSMLFLSPLVDSIHYVWILLPISALLISFAFGRHDRKRIILTVVAFLCILFLAHPDLHDAIYYGWENLVQNGLLVERKYALLTGAYLYGLIGLEICIAAHLFLLRKQMQ